MQLILLALCEVIDCVPLLCHSFRSQFDGQRDKYGGFGKLWKLLCFSRVWNWGGERDERSAASLSLGRDEDGAKSYFLNYTRVKWEKFN